MQSHSRTMSSELGRRSEEASNGKARLGIGLLAFQAVGREGPATLVYKLGRRLNFGAFFRVIGVVLMVFAAGLLADAVENMQKLGWLPFLRHSLWDSSSVLSQDSSIGDIFHSFLGYADHP